MELSGASAKDCGIFPLNSNPASGWECAVKLDSQGRPFWFAVQFQGIDSETWQAIGRDVSGNRYVLAFDSYPRGEPVSDRNFTVTPCADGFDWPKQPPYLLGCARNAP